MRLDDNEGRESGFLRQGHDDAMMRSFDFRPDSMLKVTVIEPLEAVIVARTRQVWDEGQIGLLRQTIRRIATGQTACKFLVLDIPSCQEGMGKPPNGFDECVEDVMNLIVEVPVISIAWARGLLAGADLEMALTCSIMVGEPEAALSFERDLVNSLRSYSLLAQKIGFVQAERLMENGTVLGAKAAYDLMLLHSIVPPQGGPFDGIAEFVKTRTRRHNSSYGIYRAQRIAMLHA